MAAAFCKIAPGPRCRSWFAPASPSPSWCLAGTALKTAAPGRAVEITPEMLRARGVFWREHTLLLMNLMDLGPTATSAASIDEHPRAPISTIVVPDARAFRPGQSRRQTEPRAGTDGGNAKG